MSALSHTELLAQFLTAAVRAVATVEVIVATADAVASALIKATAGEETVLVAEPDAIDPQLLSVFRTHPKVVTTPTSEQFRTVHTGITDAICAVAATGSVCVAMSDHFTSAMSMLTRRHIVLVDGRTIVARPSDVFTAQQQGGTSQHRSFTFITGPSATADMGPLVRGVHGPGALHIIVLEQPHE